MSITVDTCGGVVHYILPTDVVVISINSVYLADSNLTVSRSCDAVVVCRIALCKILGKACTGCTHHVGGKGYNFGIFCSTCGINSLACNECHVENDILCTCVGNAEGIYVSYHCKGSVVVTCSGVCIVGLSDIVDHVVSAGSVAYCKNGSVAVVSLNVRICACRNCNCETVAVYVDEVGISILAECGSCFFPKCNEVNVAGNCKVTAVPSAFIESIVVCLPVPACEIIAV